MNEVERDRLISILRQIILVEDVEIKDCALESLIDMLEDKVYKKGEHEATDRT